MVLLLVSKEIEGEADFLKKLEQVKKLEIATMQEASVLVAFSSAIPDLFSEAGSGTYGKAESALLKYKTWKDWKEKGKENIQNKLAIVKTGLNEAVSSYRASDTPPHAAMLLSISESCGNLHNACDFISSSTESLEAYGMKTNRAYCLSTRLLEAYFQELSKVQAGVSDSFVTKDQNRLAATVWYSVSRTLDVMQEFQAVEFKGHTAISSEYIKFMVQNAPSSDTSSFSTKVKELEKSIAANKKSVDSALKASSTASSKADSAVKLVEAVAKRVSTLEARG